MERRERGDGMIKDIAMTIAMASAWVFCISIITALFSYLFGI